MPEDLRNYKPSEEEDAFQIVTGDAAVFWLCVMILLGWVCAR